jgi:hypothetical protein
MSTHPIIDRLAELNQPEMNLTQVAWVLGRSDAFVQSLRRRGEIECLGMRSGSGHDWDAGSRHTRPTIKGWLVTQAAVLTYLVRATSGDREVILHAIEQVFPQHLKLCRSVARKHPLAAATPEQLPANVVRMTGASPRPPRSSTEWHPDQLPLFTA